MHHVRDDRRCEKTVEIIYDAMLELVKSKPLEEISVTDISRVSGVSRSTFYRSFDKPSDVFLLACEREFQLMFDSYMSWLTETGEAYRNSTFLDHFFKFFEKNGKATELLIKRGTTDTVFEIGLRTVSELAQQHIIPNLDDPDDYEYIISIRSGLALSLLFTWIRNERKKSVGELMAILKKSNALGGSK